MSARPTTPGARTRRSPEDLTPPFDAYPYLVTRIGRCALRHLTVLPVTWSRARLLDLTRRQAGANRLDTCLALGPGDVVYVGADGTECEETYVPTGLPVVDRLCLAGELPRTTEMAERQARLRAYADAQRGSGYIVGDGLEAGRRATPDDILRLTGREGGGPHPGLARCPTCGELGGDYLATHGEGNGDRTRRVIRVHCRCENHNRCAGCGDPLAEHRLSAYYFIEETGSVCYVAAYCAFSHRCPTAAQPIA